MLKEMSAIAAWAELGSAQHHIDAALQEIEEHRQGRVAPCRLVPVALPFL